MKSADLSSTETSLGFSFIPNELLDKPIMFILLSSTQVLYALLVKHDRFTVKRFKDQGSPTTLDAYPAESETASNGAKYLALELELKTTRFTSLACATEAIFLA